MMFAVFFVLVIIALAFVLVPLLRERQKDVETALPRQGVNTLLYRDRLQELEAERDIGKIDAEQFAQLKNELEINFLADARGDDGSAPINTRSSRWLIVAVIAILPAISLGLYLIEGQWRAVSDWQATQKRWEPLIEGSLQGKPVSPEEAKDLTAGDYIRVLQGILQRSPDHVAGWQDLGMAYMQVGLYHYAEAAFQRALTLVPNNSDLMLSVVEAKMGQGKGALDKSGIVLLHQILQQEPSNPKARMMLGMASYTGGDYDQAIGVWQSLLQDTPPDSEGAKILQSSIERAKAKRDAPVASAATGSSGSAAAGEPQLKVSVSVNGQVPVEKDGSWTLFIYAKAVNGMPMPVAIKRMPYTQAPLTVTLDDHDAMAPMAKLSTSKEVKVYARLSKSGQAIPQAGDYMATTDALAVKAGVQPITLDIAELVK